MKSVSPTLAFFLKTPFCSNLYPAEGRSKLEELISSVRRMQHSSELPLVMSEFLMGMCGSYICYIVYSALFSDESYATEFI